VIRPGVALALGAALLAGVVVLVAEDLHGAWITIAILAPIGTLAVLAAHRVRPPASLPAQFAFTGALAVGQLVVIVALFDKFMIVVPNDALVIGVIAVYCGAVAVWVGRLLARRVSDRLAAEEHARSSLIAAVSHDLRTPITSLQLLVEAIDDEVVTEDQRKEYLSRLSTHVRALSALIDDLFELSRLQTGDIRWSMEQVRIDELVSETVAAMAPAAEAKHVAVRAELNGSLAPAGANPEQIQRVLFNLIQNAIRHTPARASPTTTAPASSTRSSTAGASGSPTATRLGPACASRCRPGRSQANTARMFSNSRFSDWYWASNSSSGMPGAWNIVNV
jgi:signal transduction histidine kinase